jgi:hypothetical protein
MLRALVEKIYKNQDSVFLVFRKTCGYEYMRIYSKLTTEWNTVIKDSSPYRVDPTMYSDAEHLCPLDPGVEMLRDVIKGLQLCTNVDERMAYTIFIE